MADQTPISNTRAADHGNCCRIYSLALNLSAIVAGLVYLVLGVCIVMLLFQHAWIYAALLFGFAVLVFLAIMFAEVVSLGLEALTGKLSKFIFS